MQSDGLDRREFMKGVAAGAVGLGLTGASARQLFAQEQGAKPGNVKTRVLGRTGIKSSVIHFGGVRLRPEDEKLLAVGNAWGINHYDVAWGYGGGRAEEAMGRFLKSGVDRSKIYVTTKGSGYRPPQGSTKVVHAHLREALTKSLKRMQTEYVDIFMWPHGASTLSFLENKAMQEAMRKLREEKLIRHFGVSTHSNYKQVSEAAIKSDFYEVVLTVLNVCTQNKDKAEPVQGRRGARLPEDTRNLLKLAKEKNVGILAMKCANDRFLSPNTTDLLKGEFKKDTPLSRHQQLYRYCLQQEGVGAAVVGINSAQHLKEAIAVGAM